MTAPVSSMSAAAALSTAIRTESTRLIWPAPMPAVASPFDRTMAFERTCLQTPHREDELAPLLLGGRALR